MASMFRRHSNRVAGDERGLRQHRCLVVRRAMFLVSPTIGHWLRL